MPESEKRPSTSQSRWLPSNPSHAGGVITLQRHYQGIDSRWTHRGELGVPLTFTTGLNYENMSENRKGCNNFRLNSGVPEYGQKVSCAATNAI